MTIFKQIGRYSKYLMRKLASTYTMRSIYWPITLHSFYRRYAKKGWESFLRFKLEKSNFCRPLSLSTSLTICNNLIWFKRKFAIIFGHTCIECPNTPKLSTTKQEEEEENGISHGLSMGFERLRNDQIDLHILSGRIVSLTWNVLGALCLFRHIALTSVIIIWRWFI